MDRKCMLSVALLLTMLVMAVYTADAQLVGGGKGKDSSLTTMIRGVVRDTDGEPLPGVTVQNDSTKKGTVTDVDGVFRMAGGPQTLKFSFVGKKPLTMRLKPGKMVDVMLEDEAAAIDELVVTGIYTRKKESFTGSSSTFNAADLKSVGNTNVIQSLKTLDPAFAVLESNEFGSDPNRLPDLEIRGKSSIVGMKEQFGEDPNQPLFILDGFETTLQTIMDLSLDRIQSVTLLKDAASTAIYGSKAANGVVVVETKAPQQGKIKVNYNGSFNISWADLSDYNLMNAAEKLEFERLSGNFESNLADMQDRQRIRYNQLLAQVERGVDTYWLSEPLRKGLNQRHGLYLQGGNNELRYGIGLTYNKVDGVMKQSKRDNTGGYIDIMYRVGKLQFTEKMSVDYTDYTNPIVNFSSYANANPYYEKRNPDGSINKWLERPDRDGSTTTASPWVANPLWDAEQSSYNKGNSYSFRNNFNMEYRPIQELMLRARISVSKSTSDAENFRSPLDSSFDNAEQLKKGTYNDNRSDSFSWDGDVSLTFGKLFAKAHQVNLVAGASFRENKTHSKSFSAEGFPEGDFTTPGFANSYSEGGKPTYNEMHSRNVDFYLNGGYSYMSRYLLDVNLRQDGSSVFGTNKRFTTTWSAGLGWNIANEDFIRNNTTIFNMLKIRGSIGNPGNQSFGSFNAITTYVYNNWLLNYFGTGVIIDAFGDPNLDWQKTIDLNVGLDLSMFNRLHVTMDVYHKNTDPLLASIGIPLSVGTSRRLANIGQQITNGFSGTVRYSIIYKPENRINWTTSLSFARNRSEYRKIGQKLDQYNQENIAKNMTRYYDGGSPTAIWAVRSAGIDPATGKEIFIKKDGTLTFEHSYDDEVKVGDTRPDLEGVFGNTLYFKGFSAGIQVRYSFGSYAFNSTLYDKIENISRYSLVNNQDRRALYDRWQKPGDVAQFKSIRDNTTSNPMSSRFVQKNDFITIESVRIGYELPYKWIKPLRLQGVYLNAYMNDIARWATIEDERGTYYPFSRSVSIALGINF